MALSSSVNTKNLKEIDQIVEIYPRFGAKYLYLNPVAPYGRARERMADLLLSDQELQVLAYRYFWAVTEESVPRSFAFEHGGLLPKCEDFQGGVATTAQEEAVYREQGEEEFQHKITFLTWRNVGRSQTVISASC